jgi:hypothetical protein
VLKAKSRSISVAPHQRQPFASSQHYLSLAFLTLGRPLLIPLVPPASWYSLDPHTSLSLSTSLLPPPPSGLTPTNRRDFSNLSSFLSSPTYTGHLISIFSHLYHLPLVIDARAQSLLDLCPGRRRYQLDARFTFVTSHLLLNSQHTAFATMGLNYYASSPVLILPQQPSNYFMNHHHHDEIGTPNYAMTPSPSPPRKSPSKYPTPPSLNYLAQSSNGVAGRKRSRADIGDEHDDDHQGPARPVQSLKPKVAPIMGPGMTLVYPDEPSLNIAAESQTGTWVEEKMHTPPAENTVARPKLVARKSQRRSIDSTTNIAPDQTDPIVLRLGIGWKRIPESQASGSETYIRNQYPYVKQPKVLLQHEGLGVLVARSEPIGSRGLLHQWWIFTEDLNQCRLLCNSDEEEVFRRLSNKRQDERGNWIPDILADGQIINGKDYTAPPTKIINSEEGMEVDQ